MPTTTDSLGCASMVSGSSAMSHTPDDYVKFKDTCEDIFYRLAEIEEVRSWLIADWARLSRQLIARKQGEMLEDHRKVVLKVERVADFVVRHPECKPADEYERIAKAPLVKHAVEHAERVRERALTGASTNLTAPPKGASSNTHGR